MTIEALRTLIKEVAVVEPNLCSDIGFLRFMNLLGLDLDPEEFKFAQNAALTACKVQGSYSKKLAKFQDKIAERFPEILED